MIIKEKEIKISVNIEGGSALLEDLKKTDKIDSFHFSQPITQEIEDIYLDYDDFTLKNNNSYLRIRGRDDLHSVSFRKEIIEHNMLESDEISHPLSDEGLKIIIKNIENSEFLKTTPVLHKPTFVEVFQSLGLKEKLRVHIKRIEKNIFVEDIKIGKIKIDEFYYFPKPKDIFYLIEVDTYKKAYHPSIDNFVNVLYSKYGYRVEPIYKNKYTRGIELHANS